MRILLAALIFTTLFESPCLAWGRTGHEIIGFIAEQQLTPEARSGVRRLLRGRRLYDPDVANWADDIVKNLPDSAPWHYVNIPLGAGNYQPERDCPTGDCIISRLETYRTVLSNKSEADMKRADALKFVIHFIGDIQQPLHCVDANNRGGNDVEIAEGPYKGSNLHKLWDSQLLNDAIGRRSLHLYEKQLLRDLTPTLKKQLTQGNLREWVNQCHAHGEIIFEALKIRGGKQNVTITDSYLTRWRGDLELDLERAGLRLAVILNDALAGEKITRTPPPSRSTHRRRRHR